MASNKEYGKEAVRIKELEAKAEKGDENAQMDLIYCYNNGDGVEKNLEKGFELATICAEKGNDEAQFILGIMYYMGAGVEQNDEKAFEWLKKSAKQGDTYSAIAQDRLAEIYYDKQDLDEAYNWAVLAHKQGFANFGFLLKVKDKIKEKKREKENGKD